MKWKNSKFKHNGADFRLKFNDDLSDRLWLEHEFRCKEQIRNRSKTKYFEETNLSICWLDRPLLLLCENHRIALVNRQSKSSGIKITTSLADVYLECETNKTASKALGT